MRKLLTILGIILLASCGGDDSPAAEMNNNIPPNPPSLISPSNGGIIVTQVVDQAIDFQWSTATDPDNDIVGYRIWIDSDPNFSNPFNHFSDVTNTTSFLQPNQEYYWRVTTRDSNGNVSNNSQTWSFQLNYGLAPSAPQLVFPLHETLCSNDNLTFNWNSSNEPSDFDIEYKLYISASPSFDNNVDIYTTSETEYNITLQQGTSFYWKVEASNGNNSSFSEVRSLYTQGDGVSNTIPQLEYIYPENDDFISNTSLTLEWEASDNETNNNDLIYKVYFSEVGQDLVLIEENTSILSYEVTGLNSGVTYQWSIWVTDENGATNVGEVYTFTVD